MLVDPKLAAAVQVHDSAIPALVMESSPETAITQAFNPFVPTQAAYGMGATGLIYEPLIQFNLAAPPKFYPWLATAYKWSNWRQVDHLHDPLRREVEQRHGAHPGRRRLHLQPGQEEHRDQPRRPEHLQRQHVR